MPPMFDHMQISGTDAQATKVGNAWSRDAFRVKCRALPNRREGLSIRAEKGVKRFAGGGGVFATANLAVAVKRYIGRGAGKE